MPKEAKATTSTDVDDGWAALRAGQWGAAQECFDRALTQAATPEALEGLSWAAWWLDDAETVFAARERAHRLYRERGEAAAAARMAIWLAVDQLDFHGATAVASGWLQRAHRLLDPLDAGPDHGWLAFFDGYFAYGAGDTDSARKHAAAAAKLGRRFDVPDVEMLGLALEGAALVSCAQVEAGMRCLDEATATALAADAAIPIAGAWTCCFLVSACTAVRDYERAFEWCDRIAEFADRYGSRYMLAFCRAEYGDLHLARGRWHEAETNLVAAVDDYSTSRPAWVGSPLRGLAELRRRQGSWEEADRLLDEAEGYGSVLLGRARLALDRGDAVRAVELTERYLRQLPESRMLDRASGLEVLTRAQAAHGEVVEARATVGALRDVVRLVGTKPMRASADLAEGIVAAAGDDHERARRLLEDAIDLFQQSGAPFEAAQARIELATTLVSLGRADAAEREARDALDRLSQLGAEAEAARAQRLLDAFEPPLPDVTPREREVLALLTEGLTNRQIAERLVVSEHTVHRHVTNILRKLDLPSRSAAAAYAARSGPIEPPG